MAVASGEECSVILVKWLDDLMVPSGGKHALPEAHRQITITWSSTGVPFIAQSTLVMLVIDKSIPWYARNLVVYMLLGVFYVSRRHVTVALMLQVTSSHRQISPEDIGGSTSVWKTSFEEWNIQAGVVTWTFRYTLTSWPRYILQSLRVELDGKLRPSPVYMSTTWPGNGDDNVLRYAAGVGPSALLLGMRATDGGYDHHVVLVGSLRSHPTSLSGGKDSHTRCRQCDTGCTPRLGTASNDQRLPCHLSSPPRFGFWLASDDAGYGDGLRPQRVMGPPRPASWQPKTTYDEGEWHVTSVARSYPHPGLIPG
ncbi:hypothetical protein BJV78DRAFT_1354507 [Lactifluus subvellereus]|nr:hypothetical protein BJV78DRAFT_1354507 [Lactifluus subvellereus]